MDGAKRFARPGLFPRGSTFALQAVARFGLLRAVRERSRVFGLISRYHRVGFEAGTWVYVCVYLAYHLGWDCMRTYIRITVYHQSIKPNSPPILPIHPRTKRREIQGGSAVFVDQAPVRAAVGGRVLLLEGMEKVERNVLPLLNSLLENREMPLEDGRFLLGASGMWRGSRLNWVCRMS